MATLVLVVVTMLYVGLTRKLSKEAEAQAKSSADQAEAARQMATGSVRPVIRFDRSRLLWNTVRYQFYAEFALTNIGNGPAMNPTVWFVERDQHGDYFRRPQLKKTLQPIAAGQSHPEEKQDSVNFVPEETERQKWLDLTKRDESDPFYGFDIQFDDVYGDRFLIEYRPKHSVEWRFVALWPGRPDASVLELSGAGAEASDGGGSLDT